VPFFFSLQQIIIFAIIPSVMNILFILRNLGQISLICKLVKEGNVVKVYEIEKSWLSEVPRSRAAGHLIL